MVGLTPVQGKILLSRMAQLLFTHIEATNSLVDIGQVVGATVAVDEALDLSVVELQVGEDRQVGSERAKDAVIAEMDDTIGVKGQIVGDLASIGRILGEAGIILGWASVINGRTLLVDGNRTSLIL